MVRFLKWLVTIDRSDPLFSRNSSHAWADRIEDFLAIIFVMVCVTPLLLYHLLK